MKALLLSILFVVTFSAYGQDTLVYKDGTIKPVLILEINNGNQMLKYVYQGDTMVVLLSKLSDVIVNSELEDSNFELAKDPVFSSGAVEIENGVLVEQRKYQYGKFSAGLNFLPAVTGTNGNPRVFLSSNICLNAFGQYKFNKRFGFELDARIGLNFQSPPSVLTRNYNYENEMGRQTVYDIKFSPVIYFNVNSAPVSVFLKPGFAFGQNLGLNILNYTNYQPSYSVSYEYEQFKRNYNRVALALGTEIHVSRSLAINLEIEGYSWDGITHKEYNYSWSESQSDYYLNSENNYQRRRSGIAFRAGLSYHFGSTKLATKN